MTEPDEIVVAWTRIADAPSGHMRAEAFQIEALRLFGLVGEHKLEEDAVLHALYEINECQGPCLNGFQVGEVIHKAMQGRRALPPPQATNGAAKTLTAPPTTTKSHAVIVQVGEWCRTLADVASDPLIADVNGGEIIGRGQLGVLYGPPGVGKTALDIGFGFAIEAGDGFGHSHLIEEPIYRAQKGRVLFAIYEDQHDFRRRLIAQAQQRRVELDDLNLAIISDSLNVAKERDRAELLKRIRQDAEHFGPPAFLSIDTVAAALGTESCSDDDVVGALFDLGRDLRKLGTTMLLVHHPGKDDSKGMAGSYRFGGDTDFVLRALATSTSFRLLKDKDRAGASKRPLFDYTLEFVKVEQTTSGHARTGAIVGTVTPCPQDSMPQHRAPEAKEGNGEHRLSKRPRLALEKLWDVATDLGTPPPSDFKLPMSIAKVVKLNDWRNELIRTGIIDGEVKNKRGAFHEIKLKLIEKRLIGERDGLVWVVPK